MRTKSSPKVSLRNVDHSLVDFVDGLCVEPVGLCFSLRFDCGASCVFLVYLGCVIMGFLYH